MDKSTYNSFDNILDKYIMDAEQKSIAAPDDGSSDELDAVSESKSLRVAMRMLFEAPGDDELADAMPAPDGQDAPPAEDDFEDAPVDADPPDGDADMESLDPPAPKLDVSKFAPGVARVIKNIHKIVDINALALNRVLSYVSDNYDEATSKDLERILASEFGVSSKSKYDNARIPPAAKGAGPDVGGGAA